MSEYTDDFKADPDFHSTTYYDGLGRAVMIVSSCRTDKDVSVSVVRNDGSGWCRKESLDSSGQHRGSLSGKDE